MTTEKTIELTDWTGRTYAALQEADGSVLCPIPGNLDGDTVRVPSAEAAQKLLASPPRRIGYDR